MFSSYECLSPASTVPQKNYQEYRAPQNIFEDLATQKKYPHSVP